MGPDPMGHGLSLRGQLFGYLAALHGLLFVLVFVLWRGQPWAFLGLEAVLVDALPRRSRSSID